MYKLISIIDPGDTQLNVPKLSLYDQEDMLWSG